MPFFAGIGNQVSAVVSGAAQEAIGAAGSAAMRGSGVLRIEPDQVDAAINIFEDALNKLKERVQRAVSEIEAQPTAQDRVSTPAAAAFNDAASNGQGAAIAAWKGAVEELESIIMQLRAAKETNVNTDQTVSQPFAQGLQTA